MRKKIFFAILLIVLFMLAGKIALACCNPSDCIGPLQPGKQWECQNIPDPATCDINAPSTQGTCVEVDIPVPPPSSGSGASAEEMSECVKLPAEVKLILSGMTSETTFEKGAIIAAKPLSAAECRYKKIDTSCGGFSIIDGTIACYTSEFAIVVTLSYLNNVINWMFIILMMLVSLMVIYGGFLFATAAGSPDRASRGKKVLLFAIIGLAIALLARVIPALVKFIIGV